MLRDSVYTFKRTFISDIVLHNDMCLRGIDL